MLDSPGLVLCHKVSGMKKKKKSKKDAIYPIYTTVLQRYCSLVPKARLASRINHGNIIGWLIIVGHSCWKRASDSTTMVLTEPVTDIPKIVFVFAEREG